MPGRLIFQHRVFRLDLKANPDVRYVFGDNEQRVGYGGQAAEMRDEPNAIGIATLWAPGRFWSDTEIENERQCAVLDNDFDPVFEALRQGRTVTFPLDGIGTGLADLERHSPTTFQHLQRLIGRMRELAGQP